MAASIHCKISQWTGKQLSTTDNLKNGILKRDTQPFLDQVGHENINVENQIIP
jgi:hypothetical protein